MEKISPPLVDRRKLITAGSSVVISIPKKWLNENGLAAGDELLMIANGDLTFKKMTEKNIAFAHKKVAEITHHNHLGVSQDSLASSQETPVGVQHQAETENIEK